jgi:hypothetical protein
MTAPAIMANTPMPCATKAKVKLNPKAQLAFLQIRSALSLHHGACGVAEVALTLWLIVVGVNVPKWKVLASAAG